MLVVYVEDAILISPYKSMIQREIRSLQEEFDLTDDRILKDYLGTHFECHKDGSIKLTQPKMIDRVLESYMLKQIASRSTIRLHLIQKYWIRILAANQENNPGIIVLLLVVCLIYKHSWSRYYICSATVCQIL